MGQSGRDTDQTVTVPHRAVRLYSIFDILYPGSNHLPNWLITILATNTNIHWELLQRQAVSWLVEHRTIKEEKYMGNESFKMLAFLSQLRESHTKRKGLLFPLQYIHKTG
jgi:hypothetical protein